MTPPELNPAEFMTFLLVLIRVSFIVFLAPVFGSAMIVTQVKVLLALVLSFILTMTIRVDLSGFPINIGSFALVVGGELLIGMTLALMIRFVIESVQLAGQYVGYQMGMAIVNVIDPQTGAQVSVVSQMAYIMALMIFLMFNGHYIVLTALAESFDLITLGRPSLNSTTLDGMLWGFGQMFVIAIKIGAPTLAVLFFAKVSMGIIAKTVPQMNVLFVGIPMYIVVGLFVFGMSLTFFAPILGRAVHQFDLVLGRMLRAM